MRHIQKYVANDGSEFNTAEECVKYEALCDEIDTVMEALPPRPIDTTCSFSNGHGYLQHTPEQFWPVRDALLRIGNRLYPHEWFRKSLADRSVHPSWCGRLISDISQPLSRAWFRFMCTDNQLREWGQPYYADHPDEAPLKDAINA